MSTRLTELLEEIISSVDNFELIKSLLEFPHKDIFYFVQILQRKKDHKGERLGGSNNNSRLIKAYYITSVEKLEIHRKEMITLAHVFNARVSINLNPRNFQKAAFHLLQKIANQMSNGDYHNIRKSYESICGEYHSEIDKRWLIDLDMEQLILKEEILSYIVDSHREINKKDYGVIAGIPSKTGLHIITNPFNLEHWKWKDVEIHKNNPTNLYIPIN